jgi:hypothetical protein
MVCALHWHLKFKTTPTVSSNRRYINMEEQHWDIGDRFLEPALLRNFNVYIVMVATVVDHWINLPDARKWRKWRTIIIVERTFFFCCLGGFVVHIRIEVFRFLPTDDHFFFVMLFTSNDTSLKNSQFIVRINFRFNKLSKISLAVGTSSFNWFSF